jgi:phosphate-selective porin OprO/OprP
MSEEDLTAEEQAEGLNAPTAWRDVFLNVTYVPGLQVRAGRFKIPFGLDELTSASETDFIYRSLAADYLSPSRDTGIMIHDRFFDRGLSYRVGVFRHDGDNARAKAIDGADETFAFRVSGTPLRPLVPQLGNIEFGGSFAASSLANESFRPNGLRARTIVTEDTFFEPVYVSGARRRGGVDVEWFFGPASARAEYTRATDNREGQGISGQDLVDARYRAWYLAGTWILTGETKARPLRPRRPFLQGGIGAVEVAARYERLWYDSVDGQGPPERNPRAPNILTSGDRALTLGVKWFLNRWLIVQFNGIREEVEDPERSPVPEGDPFWSQVVRFQFVL